jgi:hypothetical protein
MSEIKYGGPAFPANQKSFVFDLAGGARKTILDAHPGMTLRDWFAGLAMQGIIASGLAVQVSEENYHNALAKLAYVNADAMIAEREVKP